tara:strand:+ start:1205 stop:1564 length:360 start_codon:yes stop_codon:yes gene_type:complete
MNSFNNSVLTIATIILLIALILVGLFLAKTMFEDSYPPIISDCPDYWDVDHDGNDNVVCKKNKINTGRGGAQNDRCNNYPVSSFSGSDKKGILCEKYKWAKQCNITWDGVTNNNKACIN